MSGILSGVVKGTRGLGQSAADLMFPARCTRCGGDLAAAGPILLCQECVDLLTVSSEAICRRCGSWQPAGRGDTASCGGCAAARFALDGVLPLGPYRDALREAILEMKGPSGESLSIAVARLLAERRAEAIRAFAPDFLVAVPMYWRRRMWRGINSAARLATQLGLVLGIPTSRRLLVRRRNTLAQKDLSSTARFRNVRGAFRLRRGSCLKDARILVVDDILTTGATCNEIARTLKRGGAASVAALVAGRAGAE